MKWTPLHRTERFFWYDQGVRSGEIYHLENVPGLHGGNPKGRYVVVVSRIEDISREGDLFVDDIFVVACTASLLPDQEKRAVALPWRRDGQVNTGFRRRTHAVPEWLLKIKPSDLGKRLGYIPDSKLREIIDMLPPDPE